MTGLLLSRFTFRHWRSAPKNTLLLVLTLALGVAVYISIRLANKAAVAGFANFTELLSTQSDWIVQSPSGTLSDTVLKELHQAMEKRSVTMIPVVEMTAARPRLKDQAVALASRESFTLFGLDLVALQNLRSSRGFTGDEERAVAMRWSRSITDPKSVFISSALAASQGLHEGSSLPLVIQDKVESLTVSGIIPDREDQPRMPPNLLLMDLPALQDLAGKTGKLDRIELVIEKGPQSNKERVAVREALEQASANRWQISSPNDRRDAAAMMTRAFRWNLGILSLLALLVGLYLVFQALDGAVVRRREEIGVLRSLGVEAGMIQRAWLFEALMLGVAGGVIGTLLGWAGAQGAVRLVAGTVKTLYHATEANSAPLEWSDILCGMGIGIGASLVAGWLPAKVASLTPPAQMLIRHATQPLNMGFWSKPWVGPVLLLAATVLAFVPPLRLDGGGRFALAGYAAALFAVLGGGLMAGMGLRVLALMMRPFTAAHATLNLAASHLRRASGRHRLAAAGLLCAVSMTAGMAILVGSFDKTMRGWIARTFQADIYLTSDGAQGASLENRISAATVKEIAARPDIAEANGVQFAIIQMPEGSTMLAAGDMAFMGRHVDMAWVAKPLNDNVFDLKRSEHSCLISESFSERFRKQRGDVIQVPTPDGMKVLTIAGIFADYGNEKGSITVDRHYFGRWFKEDAVSRLMLFVKPGVSADAVRADLLAAYPGMSAFTNSHLKGEVLRIFRQTFAITDALEFIGVLVAVMGLGMTLASVLLDRRNELTTLRRLGMTRESMAWAAAWEGLLLAIGGAGCGLVVSVGLGWLLVFVINKQTFGWTLEFYLPVAQMALLTALVLVAAGSVSYAVGKWGAELPVDREE